MGTFSGGGGGERKINWFDLLLFKNHFFHTNLLMAKTLTMVYYHVIHTLPHSSAMRIPFVRQLI